MTRNHGTVMSLSYDAPCPRTRGGEDKGGRASIGVSVTAKEREREREKRQGEKRGTRDTPKDGRRTHLLRNTYGVTAAPSPPYVLSSSLSLSLPPCRVPSRDIRACSKSRFPARRSLYTELLPARHTCRLIVLRATSCVSFSRPFYLILVSSRLFLYGSYSLPSSSLSLSLS